MREFFPARQQRQLMASSILTRSCLVRSSDFHCKENDGFGSYPYTQVSSPVIIVFMKSGILFVESGMSWVYGYVWETESSVIFLTMRIRREHQTLPHSNAVCYQLTLLIGGKKFTYAYEDSRSPHANVLH